MSQSIPVTLPEWREFLGSYSNDYLRVAADEELAGLDEIQRENQCWATSQLARMQSARGRSGNHVVIFGVDTDRNDPSGDREVIFHGQWKGQQ